MKYFYFLIALTMITSCSVLKVSERQSNGFYSSNKKANTVKAIEFDLDTLNELLVVPNSEFMKGMSENINYFKKVITLEELEKEIILARMQDEVGPLVGKIGLNNTYRKYKKFLYLRFDNNSEKSKRLQLKLIHPGTLDEIFVAETLFDTVWAGVYDKNTFNPLFNSLIAYIERNSKSYNRTNRRKN